MRFAISGSLLPGVSVNTASMTNHGSSDRARQEKKIQLSAVYTLECSCRRYLHIQTLVECILHAHLNWLFLCKYTSACFTSLPIPQSVIPAHKLLSLFFRCTYATNRLRGVYTPQFIFPVCVHPKLFFRCMYTSTHFPGLRTPQLISPVYAHLNLYFRWIYTTTVSPMYIHLSLSPIWLLSLPFFRCINPPNWFSGVPTPRLSV